MNDRFQPPQGIGDARTAQALGDVSKVLDARPRIAFAAELATALSVSPGEIRRLSPRSGGQTAVLPPAGPSNAGQSVKLLVSGPGALTVTPVSGTINGASALSFEAGTYELEITSDGERWLTPGLANSAVTTAKLADLSVTTAKIAADAVTTAKILDANVTNAKLANMAERRVKLRADSAGTGAPTDGTGAQVGEILRLANRVQDSTSTGTVVTYTLTEASNVIDFAAGIGALTLRGATIPAESGQVIVWGNGNTGVNVTFNDEDASAAAAGNRFRTPGAVAYVLAPNHRAVTVYTGSRHKFIATA